MRIYRRGTWAIVGLWFLCCITTLRYNGPFFDEGIYLSAGQRVLEGHGYSDGYLGWFAGSLLWPALAGIGVKIAGLTGARAIASTLAALGLLAFAGATKNLFGERASFWATLAFALNAPLFALARMGVYDATALAATATSLWAITALNKRDHRGWLVAAAVGYTLGMFAKYPIGLMLFPLLGVLVVLRKEKSIADIVLFGFISLAIGLAFYLPVREQLGAFISYRLTTSPASGVSVPMIASDLLRLSILPALLAGGGWLAARSKHALATVLLLSLAMWPAYHLVLADPVSSNKHLVFGFLFAYPLIGLALSELWKGAGAWGYVRKGAAISLVLVLAAFGLGQLSRFNHAWPDARPVAHYLLDHVQPGQKLLINESWPYTMYLYRERRITTPWDVFDVYRIEHGQSEIALCEYDWFVDSQGSYRWPEEIQATVHGCGTFELVLTSTSEVVSMGRDLDYVRYPVSVFVWQNRTAR